jgi:hypothetical protein
LSASERTREGAPFIDGAFVKLRFALVAVISLSGVPLSRRTISPREEKEGRLMKRPIGVPLRQASDDVHMKNPRPLR